MLLMIMNMPAATAEEMLVQARVIRAEPVLTRVESTRVSLCEKPGRRNLHDLLEWDLRTGHCGRVDVRTRIEGFRVYYEWDDQEFSFVADSQPGSHIPLKVRFDR